MVSGSHIEEPVMRLSSLAYCGAYRGSFQPNLCFYRPGGFGMFQINGIGGLGRELDRRHQRRVWGQLHLPDHVARRGE